MSSYTLEAPRDAVIDLGADARARFISRTYTTLFGAIVAFTGLEVLLFRSALAEPLTRWVVGGSMRWLMVLGLFMVVSWVATRFATSARSRAAQYGGLALFVAAEALIFVPLLYIANSFVPGAIEYAVLITLGGFAGLTGIAFITRKDFSFLRAALMWGFGAAGILIVLSLIFGWNLGVGFMVGMVVLAGLAILYDTSNILHHYPEDAHVGAALQLFASVALMLWYVLQLTMTFMGDD